MAGGEPPAKKAAVGAPLLPLVVEAGAACSLPLAVKAGVAGSLPLAAKGGAAVSLLAAKGGAAGSHPLAVEARAAGSLPPSSGTHAALVRSRGTGAALPRSQGTDAISLRLLGTAGLLPIALETAAGSVPYLQPEVSGPVRLGERRPLPLSLDAQAPPSLAMEGVGRVLCVRPRQWRSTIPHLSGSTPLQYSVWSDSWRRYIPLMDTICDRLAGG
ncbi:UNVERIFIED_CONTAM: hypothetical protein FKN15_034753 [Acipenser sinensis]